jgi:hypothetical protein
MPCRQHFRPCAVDLVQALAPGKMQTPCNFVDTWRWIFLQSAIYGEPNFVTMTPQLNAPIIAERSDVENSACRIAKQLGDRHSDRVTHAQKRANLRTMSARYPAPQRSARGPCDIRERKEIAACGGINASGEIDTQAFPERRSPQVWRRGEQIADRFRDPDLTFHIRLAH